MSPHLLLHHWHFNFYTFSSTLSLLHFHFSAFTVSTLHNHWVLSAYSAVVYGIHISFSYSITFFLSSEHHHFPSAVTSHSLWVAKVYQEKKVWNRNSFLFLWNFLPSFPFLFLNRQNLDKTVEKMHKMWSVHLTYHRHNHTYGLERIKKPILLIGNTWDPK